MARERTLKVMGYDISNSHIDEASPEGRGLEAIVTREGVSPEEAVRWALSMAARKDNSAKGIIGMFSSPEDRVLMDEVMEMARENRKIDAARDFDL